MIDSPLRFTSAGPQFGLARASGSAMTAWGGLPVVDQYDPAEKFVKGSLEAAFTDKGFTKRTARAGLRAFTPWGNWLPVAAGFAAMMKGLPESRRKGRGQGGSEFLARPAYWCLAAQLGRCLM